MTAQTGKGQHPTDSLARILIEERTFRDHEEAQHTWVQRDPDLHIVSWHGATKSEVAHTTKADLIALHDRLHDEQAMEEQP